MRSMSITAKCCPSQDGFAPSAGLRPATLDWAYKGEL